MTFSFSGDSWAQSPRLTGRNTGPAAMPAAAVQESSATLVHVGIGTVRTRPCFPTRSTMHHRPSRCWMYPERERRYIGAPKPATQKYR